MFLTESWFWRGTQSAIFYYLSCAPLLEFQHKRHRRQEAARSEKEKAEIITKQPGVILQPGPFQTNPEWAEEMLMGPGPPTGPQKRWKKEHDRMVKDVLKAYTEEEVEEMKKRAELRSKELGSLYRTPTTGQTQPSIGRTIPAVAGTGTRATPSINVPNTAAAISVARAEGPRPMSPISEVASAITDDSSSTDEVETGVRVRPSMERRLSSAVENIKDTIKGWNWKRYDREDEVLSGFQERLRGMWDKATNYGVDGTGEAKKAGRKRAGTTDSERYDWERTIRNPEINELHPPTVSKLPATKAEAAWMKLPPPSRAVMEGKMRPQDETMQRWPLAIIGRNSDEWEELRKQREIDESNEIERKKSEKSMNSNDSKSWKTPDLSNSSSDEDDWSVEDETDWHLTAPKPHPAPIGWTPVRPKPVAKVLQRPAQHWGREATY